MTKSHKVIVLLPPFLIGITILMTLFAIRHNENQRGIHTPPLVIESATTTEDFLVTEQLPPPDTVPPPPVQVVPPVETDPDDMVMCTMDVKTCADGSYVSRVAPGCAFAACPVDGGAEEVFTCSPESRGAVVCPQNYNPVCAAYQVECVTTPCPPVPLTFSNTCMACADNNVVSYTTGSCESDDLRAVPVIR